MGKNVFQIRRGLRGSSVMFPVEHLSSNVQLRVSSHTSECDLLGPLAVAGLVS